MSKIKEIKALEAKIQMSAEFLEMDADDSNSQQLIATYYIDLEKLKNEDYSEKVSKYFDGAIEGSEGVDSLQDIVFLPLENPSLQGRKLDQSAQKISGINSYLSQFDLLHTKSTGILTLLNLYNLYNKHSVGLMFIKQESNNEFNG